MAEEFFYIFFLAQIHVFQGTFHTAIVIVIKISCTLFENWRHWINVDNSLSLSLSLFRLPNAAITLNQHQGHQHWYETGIQNRGYRHTKCWSCSHSVRENANQFQPWNTRHTYKDHYAWHTFHVRTQLRTRSNKNLLGEDIFQFHICNAAVCARGRVGG